MDLRENELRGYIPDNGKPMWAAHNNHNIRSFKEEEIKIITDNYSILLGKGAFGEVYKGVLDDNSLVAVKRYIHNAKENFAKEVIVHCEINHRNVIRLIGCCIGDKSLMMVTEYIANGNLSDILHSSEISISLETRLGIAIGCAEALCYMHSQMYGQVIHGDIKPANILLDENNNAKLSDFGISKLLSTDKTLYTTHVIGSIGYMDPLFARTGRLTSKSDVYSFGVVLLELITRRKAVNEGKISLIEDFTQVIAKGKKTREFYDVKIADDNNMRILDGIGKLAAKCLSMDIEKRPEMKDVAERLRMLRKAQYESQEKTFFGWIWRSKQAPQNNIPIDKMNLAAVQDKHLPGIQVAADQGLKAEVQAPKLSEADTEVHNVTTSMEGSSRYRGFGSLQHMELEELLSASAEVMGKGKYGTTYKAELNNGSVLIVKRLRTDHIPEAVFKERITTIGAIEHELIVPLRRYYFSRDEKLLVYDFFGNGSLASNLHGNETKEAVPIGWEIRSTIALSAACAVAYIHSTNAIASHGNIKSTNILLTMSYEARISEHGINALVSNPTLVASFNTAPEVMDMQIVSQKADVYSYGVLLLELLTGVLPTSTEPFHDEGRDLVAWITAVPEQQWAEEVLDQKLLMDNSVVKEMLQFLQLAVHCCKRNPNLRPVMSEVAHRIEEIRSS